jgi:hypothetical protein
MNRGPDLRSPLPAVLWALLATVAAVPVRTSAQEAVTKPNVAASVGEDTPEAAAGEKSVTPTSKAVISLVGDQTLNGTIVDAAIEIETRYGRLTIPTGEILKLRMQPKLPTADAAALDAALALVASDKDDSTLSEANFARIRSFGPAGLPWVEKAKATADESRKDDLQALIDQMRKDPDVYSGTNDEIVARRFTVRGRILLDNFRVECLGRELSVPRDDIVAITYEEPEEKQTLKILPQHMERAGFLVTKIKLRKGQRFRLEPSGSMTFNGQTFGPQGLTNHRWNSRNLGCLQFRVGTSGAWQILGADLDTKADQAGELQFCVHMYNADASGEFKVIYRDRARTR